MKEHNDDKLVFADEPEQPIVVVRQKPWKILVVDDDEEVHVITRLVLRDYVLEHRGVELISAYSAAEAQKVLEKETEIAVILLDVVMESDDAGLKLARWIRHELRNSLVRIILRTGQPGAAPEKRVITDYEINDYKAKTEITDIKLYTAITVALRGYRDLKIIRRSKEGFEKIIKASGELFKNRSFLNFYNGVLLQLTGLLKMDDDSLYLRADGMALHKNRDEYKVIAGTGQYSTVAGESLDQLGDRELTDLISKAIDGKESFFNHDSYVGYFNSDEGTENIIFLKTSDEIQPVDKELIQVFSTNVAVAFSNLHLNMQMESTQKEIIFTLGEVVESRHQETGNHVRRVGEVAALLGEALGMSTSEVEMLRLAAPMHDIGKIGVPDSILLKPGRLTEVELIEMRKHTVIGSEILKAGNRGVLNLASVIALTHHERWDGKGYPAGLVGEDIPLAGRIVSVVDVFDALLHDRVYKSAWTLADTMDYLKENSGSQFDPRVVEVFMTQVDKIFPLFERYAE